MGPSAPEDLTHQDPDLFFHHHCVLIVGLDCPRLRHPPWERVVGGYVSPGADVAHILGKIALPVLREEPIYIDLGCVGMRCVPIKSRSTVRWADIRAFLELPWIHYGDGYLLSNSALHHEVGGANEHGKATMAKLIRLSGIISEDDKILLAQGADKIGASLRT